LEKGGIESHEDRKTTKTEFEVDPQFLLGPQKAETPPPGPSFREKRRLISQVLEPYMGTMIVTPKEIDVLIDEVSDVVAGALNTSFHEGVSYDEVFKYLAR
ncbi:MAG: GPR endopeptidase, partial [Firmicutes bacterium]|nr:GPR endopeptidase [Bacillota bacterium]